MELLPRPRSDADRGDRLARRTGARSWPPLDGRRRRVGLDLGARHGWPRPPSDRDLPTVAARARDALRRGLQRGALGGCTGPAAGPAWGEPARVARHGALGRLPPLVRWARRAAAVGRRGRARPIARLDSHPLGRRASRLSLRAGLSAGLGCAELRLAGGLLAVPPPARRRGAQKGARRLLGGRGSPRTSSGAPGRSAGSAGAL